MADDAEERRARDEKQRQDAEMDRKFSSDADSRTVKFHEDKKAYDDARK